MNKFKDYTRNTAFHLDLSLPMIQVLLEMSGKLPFSGPSHAFSSIQALERRGLVEYTGVKGGRQLRPKLTTPGKRVIQLLEYAGFVEDLSNESSDQHSTPDAIH